MIALTFCLSAMLGLLVTSSSDGTDAAVRESPIGNDTILAGTLALTPHDPILIDGNSGFTGLNSSTGVTRGSGTASDPYVIEGWEIIPSPGNGIEISNADVHFVIQDCYVHDGINVSGHAIRLYSCSNGTVMNCTCDENDVGFLLEYSEGNSLINNTCSSNNRGILVGYSGGNSIFNNTCSRNRCGIHILSSADNELSNNDLSCNSREGMWLDLSVGTSMKNNRMTRDGISIEGTSVEYWNTHDIDASNTVNGRPVYYCRNMTGLTVPAGAGQVILANCTNMVVEGQNLSMTRTGIELGFSSNNSILGNNCSRSSSQGIFLCVSDGNLLINNNCSDSTSQDLNYHIYLALSNSNTIMNNNCSGNNASGLGLISSNSNTILNNLCRGCADCGIDIFNSDSNTLSNNTCSSSQFGMKIAYSDGNLVLDNIFSNNAMYAVQIQLSSSNTISNNIFLHNNGAGDTHSPGHAQAFDIGSGNLWSWAGGYGNWWSDWTTPDDLPPFGVVDIPYYIPRGVSDAYPLTSRPPLDTASPLVSIALPASDPFYTQSNSVDLSGDSRENVGITSFTWSNAATGGSGMVSGTTSWSVNGIALNPGSNLIVVNASDSAGNHGSETITVVSDQNAPICTITSPADDPYYTTAGTIDLAGIASDDMGVTAVTWYDSRTGGSGTATGTTSWSISGIVLGAGMNFIQVDAADAAGNVGSDWITVMYTLTAPQNLRAIPGDGYIVLSWNAPSSNGGSPITSYRLYRGMSPGCESLLIELGNVLSYTDANLTDGVTYYHKVSAVTDLGEGPLSDEVSATPCTVPWPMFRQNAQHTGLSPVNTSANGGRLVWSYDSSGLSQNSPAIGRDGTLYVGTSSGTLLAIESNGILLWSLSTGNSIHTSPALGLDGTIYFGSGKSLYAVNPNGTVKWSYEIWGGYYEWIESSPVVGSDGTIYIGSHADRLYAFNADGTVRWYYATGLDIVSSPAIGSDGTVYFGSEDNYLYAVTPDGDLIWRFLTSGQMSYSSPCVGSDGTIYIGSGHNIDAVNPNGTLRWTFVTASKIDSSPGIGPDGTIYFGSDDYSLYAVNRNGTQRWKFTTASGVESSPAIGSDGTIYFGSWDGRLYAICPNGTQRWEFYTGSIYRSSPAIGADGTIYVGSDSGLYAVGGVLEAPSAPQVLTATHGDTQVTLQWNPPEDDGGLPVTGYTVYRGISSGTETYLTTIGIVLTYTDTSLTNGVTYYYQVSAVNAVGEGPRSAEAWVMPTSPPTCTISSPTSDPTYFTALSAVNLGGTASDDVGVTSVTWSNAATGASGTATGKTSWSINGILLNPGSNEISVTSHDGAGLTGTDTITVIRDSVAPACTINSPTSTSTYYTNGSTIDLGGTASDNLLVIEVTWKNMATGATGVASGTSSWTISGIGITSGSNLISVSASDSAGNVGIDTITVIRDISDPTCTITTPANDPSFTKNASVSLAGTAYDNVGITSVTYRNMATGASGTASGTTGWTIAGIALNVGGNLIYVNATDAAGNVGTDTITATRDSTVPTCAITSPTSSPTYSTTTSTVSLGGTASDNILVVLVTWKNMLTGASGTASGTTSWTITGISLNAGSNLIYVNATDSAGSVGTDTITVTRDSTVPTCTITSPTSDPTYSINVATIDLSGTASDNIGVSMVNWSNAVTGASGTASGTTSWTITGIALNVGSNLITVTVRDAAGNIGVDSITVTYTPPVGLTVAGTASPTSGANPLTVSFTCTPSGGASPYTYSWAFDDGGTSTLQNPTHTYESAGSYHVNLTVTDALGNSANKTIEIEVTAVTTGAGTSWLPIIVVGIVAAFAVAIAAMLLMRRRS
jgi:parallel beta-helix repeat protein